MIIAVASGKGGTGKTTVATSLALAANGAVTLLDCDVEEPNAHLFIGPRFTHTETVRVPVPKVDESRCTACGECHRVCEFNAIVSLKTKPLVFAELCHGCGGCALVCPAGAITEEEREIGVVERGTARGVTFVRGQLNVGEPMAGPLIRAVKKHASADGITFVDAPPGTSCPVVETLREADFVVLVTEPTPFGLWDLRVAVEAARRLGLRFGVVINRADAGDSRVVEYCRGEKVPVLLEIPDDRRIAEAYSRGVSPVDTSEAYRRMFADLSTELAGVRR